MNSGRGPANGWVTVRQVMPADLPRMDAFVRGLSPRSSYQRLFSPRTLSDEEIRDWTCADGREEVTFVIQPTDECEIVAVGSYIRQRPGEDAEVALVIADRWQGRGLGRTLLARLVAHARAAGVRRLLGSALSSNFALLTVARSLGFRIRKEPGSALVTQIELHLAGVPALHAFSMYLRGHGLALRGG